MTEQQFRKTVREQFPHVRVSIRTISFADLARTSARRIFVTGDRSFEEVIAINTLARDAGFLPDNAVRVMPEGDQP